MFTPGKVLMCVAVLVLSWGGNVLAQDKAWIEVRSPHFRMISNASDREARHVARAFEQMRAVFASQFPGFALESPAPLLVLAARDEETMKLLLPQAFKAGVGSQIGGQFLQGWERKYALVRLDVMTSERMNPDTYSAVYHEYIHSLLHANFRWLPTWLDEGLAEFYAYTRFEGDKMYIGAPSKSNRLQLLDARSPTPLRTLITARSSISRDQQDSALFYAQAWALTHFLTFGPGMGQGDKLKMFFNLLQRGTNQVKAFEQVFGNIEEVDKAYLKYINQIAYPTGVVPYVANVQEKDYAERQMSMAETQAELGAFFILFHNHDRTRELAEAAIKSDPKVALAHEDLGFVEFNEGKDEDALREMSQAVELDPKSSISLFAKTMIAATPITATTITAATTTAARPEGAADQKALREGLDKVVSLDPRFAPAYVELAKLDLAQGQVAAALSMAQKAEGLQPFRSGYHVLTGQILLRTGHPTEASAKAAYVAERWGGPDYDEAMELWNSIPAEKRVPEGPVAIRVMSKDVLVAEGTVKAVTCKDRAFAITVENDGKALTFHSQGFPVGYSDTLWVGHDHFTPCFHVDGLRAVLRYKAGADPAYAGDLLVVGFRDSLPAGVSGSAVTAGAR